MAAPLTLELFPLHPTLAPADGSPPSRTAPHGPAAQTTTHLLARVRAASAPPSQRPRLSAVLVLDVSGSMLGEPLDQVILSARRLCEILADTDRLGVVAFNEAAITTSPLRELGGDARRAAQQAVGRLEAGGNTNIGGALAHAALMLPRREAGERQLLLLLSDGEPNLGAHTPEALGEQARLIRQREVAVSTLGFGSSHNDDILVAVADGGGGRYAFVVDPKLAEPSFVRTLGAQLDVVAEEVRLVLSPAEGVEIVRVLDEPPTAFGAEGLRVTLPDMIAGDELNVVVELRIRPPQEGGPWRPLKVALWGRAAGTTDTFVVRDEHEVTVSRVGPFETDPTAHAALSIAEAAAMRAEARRLAERGAYAAAGALLRKAQGVLKATNGFVEGAEGPLNDAYETLVDEIRVMDEKPAAEEYQRYKKASRDYLDFAHSGAKVRGGGGLSEAPPSVHALLRQARAGVKRPKAFLHVLSGPRAGVRVALDKDRFVIGRGGRINDLTIPDARLSRQHTLVELYDDGFWVVDMGSTNGTSAEGKRLNKLRLANGTTFELGDSLIRYEEGSPGPER